MVKGAECRVVVAAPGVYTDFDGVRPRRRADRHGRRPIPAGCASGQCFAPLKCIDVGVGRIWSMSLIGHGRNDRLAALSCQRGQLAPIGAGAGLRPADRTIDRPPLSAPRLATANRGGGVAPPGRRIGLHLRLADAGFNAVCCRRDRGRRSHHFCHKRRPRGDSTGSPDGRILLRHVSWHTGRGRNLIRLDRAGRRHPLTAELNGLYDERSIAVSAKPGRYRVRTYQRFCNGNCGNLSDPVYECERSVRLKRGERVRARVPIVFGPESQTCRIGVSR
jgi:hypothetical protein